MAITKSKSKEQIERLVNIFDNHINEYKGKDYKEATVRIDFINPFLSALGWDVDNKLSLPESYREVIHEDKIKIDDSSRAPDYCITINGNKKFYIEAKKPSISLKDSISSAYQLRRYGWNAKMPISIITDFEEFSVYDCQVKPQINDKATIARINYITYKDYLKEFDFFWDTFSKESVKNGSLEKYFQSTKGKRASSSVDEEFLKSLDSWRDLLAKNLVLKNPSINEDQLNYSLQKIIDRIIFLRISEDRGVENQNQLLQAIGKNTYSNLRKLFHIADQKYNSGLFDYNKDIITDNLNIDNDILQQIIEEMYYPKSPYEFSVIPVEILGHSYEQYLGKTISINSKHKIIIEEKPEVRKAGGVYYTPQYIVDYIVQNTVGKLLGDWGSGMEDSFKKINEDNHESNQKLQGFESLARINASDNTDLYNDKIISEGRNVFIDKSNEKSGSISSIEYSRGERPIFKEGIYPSSINSDRIVSGTGNSDPNSIQSGISQSGNLESNNDSNSKNRSNARSVNQISKGNSLTPKPKPLTPADVAKLKICDPACGSGSFLLGAYQFLLNWHREYYNNAKIKNKDKYLTPDGNLTTSIKKEILLNNIYGVDIDTNAVEVTKLSLMIKAMEGETKATINHQLSAFHDRVLPSLDKNIKSGNSLIDMDFFDSQIDFEPAAEKKIKPFSWEQAFPVVFKQGGFDAVIGNPPYGADLDNHSLNYLKNKYPIGNTDTAAIFMVLSKNILKDKGYNSFIIPKPFTYASNWNKIREILLPNITTIVDCSKVWKEVKLEMTVYKTQKGIETDSFDSCIRNNENIKYLSNVNKTLCNDFGFILNGVTDNEIQIGKKINNNLKKLNDILFNQRGGMYQKLVGENGDTYVLGGKQINRYSMNPNKKGKLFINDLKDKKTNLKSNSILAQNIVAHIMNPEPHLQIISTIIDVEDMPKTVILDTINQLEVIDTFSNKFILGILNSKLISWYVYKFIFANAIRTMHFDSPVTSRIPIPQNPAPETQKQIIKLVETMLQLNKDLQTATLPEQKEQIQQRINYADKKIDQLVYQLYDLSEEEIKVVEGE